MVKEVAAAMLTHPAARPAPTQEVLTVVEDNCFVSDESLSERVECLHARVDRCNEIAEDILAMLDKRDEERHVGS